MNDRAQERRDREQAEMAAFQTAVRDQRDQDIREVARRCAIFLKGLKDEGVERHDLGNLLLAYASSANSILHEEWKREEEGLL